MQECHKKFYAALTHIRREQEVLMRRVVKSIQRIGLYINTFICHIT